MGIVASLGKMGTDAINTAQQADIAHEALDSQHMRDQYTHEQTEQRLGTTLATQRVLARYCTANPLDSAVCTQPTIPTDNTTVPWGTLAAVAGGALALGLIGKRILDRGRGRR